MWHTARGCGVDCWLTFGLISFVEFGTFPIFEQFATEP